MTNYLDNLTSEQVQELFELLQKMPDFKVIDPFGTDHYGNPETYVSSLFKEDNGRMVELYYALERIAEIAYELKRTVKND